MLDIYTHAAVILGMYDTGVATARFLGRLGIKIEGYDHDFRMSGFRSKCCNAKLCPNPTTNPLGLLNTDG